jgi:5'-nucleotidase
LVTLPVALKGVQRGVAAPSSVIIQLIAFNDFHGNLEPASGSNGLVNTTPAGGVTYLATHVARAIARNPNSIVVSAGDVIGASPLVSSLSHDEATIEAMNAMGLAISSVGNHEFDKGVPELLRLRRGGCHPVDGCSGERFAGSRFEYLAANVVDAATGATVLPAAVIRTIGGVKIGFIGETFRGTPRIVSPSGTKGLAFLDEADTANAYAARLKQEGAAAIALLIHEGGRQQGNGALDPNACANFSGGIEPIASRLSPDVTVVVSGHTHQFYNCRLSGHLVTSAGSFGRMMTRIELTVDRASGRTTGVTATNEIVTRDVLRDPAVDGIVAKYAVLAEKKADVIVGAVSADIMRRQNPAGESALGDVIADAMLDAAKEPANGGAVVAFMNSGGIRADLAAKPARADALVGSVRYRDLFAVQPFGNALTVVTMTGETVKRLLEQQFENGGRNVLQVSRGFTYRYRLSAPAGRHIESHSIAIDGREIAPADAIRVVSLDFLVDGSGGFSVLREGTDRIAGIPDVDALVAYFRTHSPVPPGPADRIVRIE